MSSIICKKNFFKIFYIVIGKCLSVCVSTCHTELLELLGAPGPVASERAWSKTVRKLSFGFFTIFFDFLGGVKLIFLRVFCDFFGFRVR